MISYLQQQVKPQMLLLMMGSIILLTLLAGYLYILKLPLSGYRQSLQNLESLKSGDLTAIPLEGRIESTQTNLQQLEKKLLGSDPQLSVNQKFAAMIGRLDAVSAKYDVQLNAIAPGEVSKIFLFQELPINIEITGSYFSLFDWLEQVERELKPITVKQFELRSNIETNSRSMKLTLVTYLFAQDEKP